MTLRDYWTPEKDLRVDAAIRRGKSYSEIAADLGGGLTAAAIGGRLWRRVRGRGPQLPPPPSPPSLDERLDRGADPGCRYIFGHPGVTDWEWCGAGCLPDKPYCAEHEALMRLRPRNGGRGPA